MTKGNNKLITVLVGVLIAVVAVQSIVMAKLYQKVDTPRPVAASDSVKMKLQPKGGAAPSVSAGPGITQPQFPAVPFGGFDPEPWDPFSELRSMRQQMDQMFNDSFGRFRMNPDFNSMWGGTTFSPNMDIEEKGESYIVRMDIPGADKSDISVNIKDRLLEVSGKVNEMLEEQGQHQFRKERRTGQFSRAVTLPGPVKADEMEAKYEDGVLTITVPKAEEDDQSHKIKVK